MSSMTMISKTPKTPKTPKNPDEWPPSFYVVRASLRHMEALGVIATIYNHLELTLFSITRVYSQLEVDVAKSLFENMSIPQRLKFLGGCVESRAKDAKDNLIHEHANNFIDCFRIVADNRNILMHSRSMGVDDDGTVSFSKASRSAPMIDKTLALDVALLQQIAWDLRDVDIYGRGIWRYSIIRAKRVTLNCLPLQQHFWRNLLCQVSC